jgi:aryl-alcohol dehydrogenase-like predicted oxidoreductase
MRTSRAVTSSRKIRAFGTSTMPASNLVEAHWVAERRGLERFRRLDAVERLIPLAEEAGLSMPHLAMAFAISHPGVTSALLGARTTEQLDDLLAGVDVVLSDDVLDRIDEIVPPGTDIGTLDQAYVPPAIQKTELRRRPLSERSAA